MKGQSSMELLVTVGIVLAFTVPVIFLLLSLTMVGFEDASVAQAEASARSMADSINVVYGQGGDAKRVVLLNLPANTQRLAISGNEVILEIRTSRGMHQAAAPFFANTADSELVSAESETARSGLVPVEISSAESGGSIQVEVELFDED